MEEAEALATKLGIMVQGSFKCFGSTNHIREKFGSGYEIELIIQIQELIQELEEIADENCITGDFEEVKSQLL